MEKEILQITISKRKLPKSKFGKWLYWKIWFRVWGIWRPRFSAWFFGALADFMYWLAPREVKEKLDKEFGEIEVHIKDKL